MCYFLHNHDIWNELKGTATLMIRMFSMKELSEPWVLIQVSSKSVYKKWKLCAFEYFQMDSNRSGHFVDLLLGLRSPLRAECQILQYLVILG